jgi:monofunctional biosynthetic peptidoglycan transglycosylase
VLRFLKWAFMIFLLVVLGGIAYYSIYPDMEKLKRVNPRKTAFMEYREREWKAKGKKVKIRQKWVKFSKISPYLVKAVIIAEDDKFWSHQGFDFDAIEKAIEKDLKEGTFKVGGSTISQQLVKNLYLSPSKNPVRKITEALITWRMEKTLSKRRILELYLNVAEWGEGVFGVEAATLRYYGKPSALVTAEEAARMVAVLPNPRRYVVNGNSRYVQRRANMIYNIMVRRGIVVKDYEDAAREKEQEVTGMEAPEIR